MIADNLIMWLHTKYKTPFTGNYERDIDNERVFVLTNERGRKISFESWQSAKLLGWRKVSN